MALLEAEALFSSGAVVAGLGRLQELFARSDPAGTLALARRRHQLGDHVGAVGAALGLPWHAQTALTGARAALAYHRTDVAFRFVEPFLQCVAPLPEPAAAGAMAVVTASILAKSGEWTRLQDFADRLLHAADLTVDMMPAAARVAWIGGRASEAWNRFTPKEGPWGVAARLELAVLAGEPVLATRLMKDAGPLGVPSAPALHLMKGGSASAQKPPVGGDVCLSDSAREVFGEGRTVHVWRTHPYRWQPWIDAARRTPADVRICGLAARDLPEPDALPWAVLDDGSLVDMLAPVPVPVAAPRGSGVRIESKLCEGVGIGHDWPENESEKIRHAFESMPVEGEPAVQILGAEAALARVHVGQALVVVAPPGDPFWAGPLPERIWPSIRVVRADLRNGWDGAGDEAVAAARELLQSDGG